MKIPASLLLMIIISMMISSCHKDNNDPAPDPNYDQDKQSLISAGWKIVFEESFSSDFSNWNIWEGGAYNNEYQCYTKDTNNIKIRDGKLIINAKRERVTGSVTNQSSSQKTFDFTSGRIEAKSNISANSTTPRVRVSARIMLPDGYGMWPAFWSYGADWPTNGEIDIMEARGNAPYDYGTNYFFGTSSPNNLVVGADRTITSSYSLTSYWHVYEVIWEKDKLTYLLDGNVVDTKLASTTSGQYIDDMFGKVQTVTLNLAVGGTYFNNPDPAYLQVGTMYVDWVRIYN